MESLSVLALEIYQKLGKQYPNLNERKEATKKYIINEITQWDIKTLKQGDNYFFKPVGFEGTEDSKPFEVRLIYDGFNTEFYELKFGNLNAPTQDQQYEWDNNDPYKLQKSLFLIRVLENKILPLIEDETIYGVSFSPYNEDGLGNDRLSYFRNMFDKLGKNKLNWGFDKEFEFYYITKKY